jgi:hypothetical protein
MSRRIGIVAKLAFVSFTVCAFATLPALSPAQSVFPSGGGATSNGYSAYVTIGQPIAGYVDNASHEVRSGFQFMAAYEFAGSLVPAQGTAGNQGTIAADLFGVVTSATLYFREGGQESFTSAPMSRVGTSDRWEGVVPAASVTVKGIQFYVVARAGANVLTLPPGAPTTRLANMPVTVVDHPTLTLPTNIYGLHGLPLAATNANPGAVFDELGSYDRTRWRYGTYDAGYADTYREPDEGAASAVPGQGFWIIARNATTISVSGISNRLDRDFVFSLNQGWNQLANPFAFPVSMNDVGFSAGVGPNPVTTYVAQADTYDVEVDTLEVGQGFWLYNDGAAGETMTIDVIGDGAKHRSSPRWPAFMPEGDEAGWSVRVEVSAGRYLDRSNFFGLRSEATPDRDPFDFREPPPPPGGYVNLTFLTPEDEHLLSDYRDLSSTGESWRLQLRSDQVGTSYQVRFTHERELPPGWQILAIDPNTLLEFDVLGTGVITGHIGSRDFVRDWHILAGEADYVTSGRQAVHEEYNRGITGFFLAPAFPNPFEATTGTVISLAVPRSTPLALCIYDLRGRVVKNLKTGEVPQGLTRVTWYGDDNTGRRVAAGVYFVRMQADGINLIKKVVLLR